MWCLREAYVKMTGEALLAPWLKELEISEVQAPNPKEGISDSNSLDEGASIKDFKIYFKGERVSDVSMELMALGPDYMVSGSVKTPAGVEECTLAMGTWEQLDLGKDVLSVAEVSA